jgi:hypothetical protein
MPSTTKQRLLSATAALAILACGVAAPAAAQTGAVLNNPTAAVAPINSAAALRAFWTPTRMAIATPMRQVVTDPFIPTDSNAAAAQRGPTTRVPGAAPTEPYDESLAEQLYTPTPDDNEGPAPAAVGTGSLKYPYTIARLYPCFGADCPTKPASFSNAWAFAPNELVGHLYFVHNDGAPFVCSATVIRRSVIATAGHCVADGNGHWYDKWMFVPAEYSGFAPFGSWNWSRVVVTGPWWAGKGTFPNRQDDALIVLAANADGKHIGDITGFAGFQYNAPLPTHITQLGYPCNLDTSFGDCVQSAQFGPVRNDAELKAGPNNNFEWGSAAFGGASGGPEFQDFGQQPLHPANTPPNETLGGNILVASTSYTYAATDQVDGASILAAPGQFGTVALQTFGDLMNDVCSTPGNC